MIEKIKLACIKYNDKLYTGFNHGECFNKMKEDGLEGYGNEGQGFITDTGRFVDRKEAYFIAKEAGQIAYGLGQKHLISEDVHLSWLNEQAEQIRSLEEQNKVIENFKENYGYTNYDTHEMLEDLQSRAFQLEDDTSVVESLLEHFGIYDENEIMNKVKSLEEQLKNAIVPKFKVGDKAYAIINGKVNLVKINRIKATKTPLEDENITTYSITDCLGYALGYVEEDLFATREDAEKRLAELEGK